jgi:hypothetical protein
MTTPLAHRADLIAAFAGLTHPHLDWAIPGDQAPCETVAQQHVSAMFKVDAGCVTLTLNEPALTVYMEIKLPVLFACERKIDLQKFRDRRATFIARGYRLWEGAP